MVKRKIEYCFCFVLTVAIIIGGCHKLGFIVRPVRTDSSISAVDAFHNLPENSVEVIGYGSSRMWRGMNPMEMYNKYGIGAYNYGGNWQLLNTTLLYLKDSLRTQKPKIALIELGAVGSYKQDNNIDGEIYITTAIDDFDGKTKYLRECFGNDRERYLSYYMPLCAFHDNWIELSEESFDKNFTARYDLLSTFGFAEGDVATPISITDYKKVSQEKIDERSREILNEMIDVCNKNDVEIIFYLAPAEKDLHYTDALSEYAENKGCVYLDLSQYIDEIGLDGDSDFADEDHLNTFGATKVADFLGKYIVDNYDVTDYRTVVGNMWEGK